MNKTKTLAILSIVSLIAFIIMIICLALIIMDTLGVEIYTSKSEYFYGYSYGGYYYATSVNYFLKDAIIVVAATLGAVVSIAWVLSIVLAIWFVGLSGLTISQKRLLFIFFPGFVFARKTKSKSVEILTEGIIGEKSLDAIKENLIYGIITPEEFEKRYLDFQKQSKLEK